MSSFKKILPLLNRLVVRRLEPQTKTASGIIINKPDTTNYGVVLEAGPGAYDANGKVVPLSVKVGDTVLLPEFGGQKVKLNDQELYIYKDIEIIAKMEWCWISLSYILTLSSFKNKNTQKTFFPSLSALILFC